MAFETEKAKRVDAKASTINGPFFGEAPQFLKGRMQSGGFFLSRRS
jgi:hypothetical protein